jgi:hypothetical protein
VERQNAEKQNAEKRYTKSWVIVILIILLALAGYFFLTRDESPSRVSTASIDSVPQPGPSGASPEPSSAPEPLSVSELPAEGIPPAEAPPPTAETPPAEPEEPLALHPIEPLPSDKPLPELGESDAPFHEALGEAIGDKGLPLVLSEELIYHVVVTVDNLPRKHLPNSIVPLTRAKGVFAVDGKDEKLAIAARNAKRYSLYAAIANATDSARLVELYRRFYPLFQRAYQELGYPKANFNDRLVVAIDDLLATPDPEPPIRLSQPRILYEYADPKLEDRSAGQKIMMRIGRENAAVLKAKLSEIRSQVAR